MCTANCVLGGRVFNCPKVFFVFMVFTTGVRAKILLEYLKRKDFDIVAHGLDSFFFRLKLTPHKKIIWEKLKFVNNLSHEGNSV